MNSQQDIMSVCLAVVRGQLTPEQAREAILGRTTPEPLQNVLQIPAQVRQEASDLAALPPAEREECLDLFKALYSQPPGESVMRDDEAFGQELQRQRLITAAQAQECLEIQKDLHDQGVRPLPRLGELLIRKGFLVPGQGTPAEGPSPAPLPAHPGPRPTAVDLALAGPENRYGRYVRTSLLGVGGAGEVWKGWDLDLGRWVALKFLKFESTDDLTRLKREAHTAAKLCHPGIARVFEIVEARDRTFLVMEYIEGRTLGSIPRQDHRRLVTLVRDAARAIAYAHSKGIVHRDIKPGNIMVDDFDRAVVMDFGLARHIESRHSVSGLTIGTPAYMAPEQALGDAPDVRSDVYSLGATLYELLADRPPFQGRNVYETLDLVVQRDPAPLDRTPGDLKTIVSKCLLKDPPARYAGAAELADDLDRWLQGDAILAHPPSRWYLLRKKAAKSKAILSAAGAGVLLAVLIAGWLIPLWLSADHAQASKNQELTRRNQARTHLDEGRRLQSRLDRLITSVPGNARDAHLLAQQAHREFDRALEAYPDHPEALLEKARVFLYEGNRAAALDYCTRAITARPDYAAAYLQRARLELDEYEDDCATWEEFFMRGCVGDQDLAARIRLDLDAVDARSTDTTDLSFARAARMYVAGDYEQASRLFEEYCTLSVSDYRAWQWTAHSYLRLPGKEVLGIRAINEALKYRPRLAPLLLLRGTAHLLVASRLRRTGDAAQARIERGLAMEDFKGARDSAPTEARAHWGLGQVCLEAGEPGLAAAHFSQALAIAPKSVDALEGRAQARLRDADLAGASVDLEEAVRLGASDARLLLLRGQLRLAREDQDGAAVDFTQALAKDPQSAEAYVGQGDVKRSRGDAQGALADYGRAASLAPGLAVSYHHRGNAQRDLGDLVQAVADLTRASTLDPGNPWIYYDLGVCACNRRDWNDALALFRKGAARMPSDPSSFWFRIWLARSRSGDRAAADRELAEVADDYAASNPGKLDAMIARFLLGKTDLAVFLKDISRSTLTKVELARAYFYAAERALAQGQKEQAIELLTRCVDVHALGSPANSTALAELRALRTNF